MEARFIISAARPEQFPDGAAGRELPEIAFLGRSNVGKSSLLNALAGREGLAFTSARPGCTQLINFYQVGGGYIFADLPGYGYARVSRETRKEWKGLIESYLTGREALRLCVVLLDSRRGWMDKDRELRSWLEFHRRPYVVVATKVDKLRRSEEPSRMSSIRKEIGEETDTLAFSAVTGRGVREIWQAISKTRNAQ
jgi:GTP-binding protein